MIIVHYTLGLYPDRTGGLNRYATDLLKEQSKEHDVSVLIPGNWKPWRSNCYIGKEIVNQGLRCYKLNNALPVPLLYGIKKTQDFINRKINTNSFERFYEHVRPEVIHLHTLMGMPEDALRFFKEKGVKIIYTSHDYFGICPKVNMINQQGELCEAPDPTKCMICNSNAPSTLFLRLRNSSAAFKLRDLLKWIRNTLHF